MQQHKDKIVSQNKESQKVSLDLKNLSNWSSTGLPNTGKDTKKVHVCSDRIKKAEQGLQISNNFQNLADLGDNDMDVSDQIQNPPAKTKIIPVLSPED